MLLAGLTAATGCAPAPPPARRSATWIAAHAMPAFDADAPPEALRGALLRLLSRGLMERDSTGRVVPALAERVSCSADSLTWTFTLRDRLRYSDGQPITSTDIAAALTAGLAREDHATRGWLLAAVRGVAQVRVGRPLPPLGIETPDARTLRLVLERPDRRLLEALAVPGVSAPFRQRHGHWRDAIGAGPWRVAGEDGTRALTLVAAAPVAGEAAALDTLRVRFISGAPRVRTLLRAHAGDLVWPLAPGMLSPALPEGWTLRTAAARPGRRLLLVLRADIPPLHKLPARHALASALDREELLRALGARGEPLRRWLPGAGTDFAWPRLETAAERAAEHARAAPPARPARRTRETGPPRPESYHVVLAYDADGAGAEVARALQGAWARAGLDAELRPLRGEAAVAEALRAAAAQAQLVESQALLPGAEAELALLIMPLRGPSVGPVRTGWRTREFDRWVAGPQPAAGFDPDAAQARLAEDRIVLPVGSLPWTMAIRTGGWPVRVHPAYGPDWTRPAEGSGAARSR